MMRPGIVAAVILCTASAAHAGHVCEQVEDGVIEVDAMLDEWRDFRPLHRGHDSEDASYQMRCAFDRARLYVMVRVKDDRVIRTGKGAPASDDNLALAFSGATAAAPWSLRIFPGTRGFKVKKQGGSGAKVEDSLQDDGWAVEVSVPLSRVPGRGPNTPLLLGDVSYRDADTSGGGTEATLRFKGSMHFSTHVPALMGFLAPTKLTVKSLKLDTLIDVDGLPGTERVVAGGRFLGVLTEAFGFVELPVESQADLLAIKLVDLDGDGTPSIITHFRQRGGGGSREVVRVWLVGDGGQLQPGFGVEVALELGSKKLVNRWSLAPAGDRRAGKKKGKIKRGATDLVVEVAAADNKGWDQATFAQVQPSPDVHQIMPPWGPRKIVLYAFEGADVQEMDAKSK